MKSLKQVSVLIVLMFSMMSFSPVMAQEDDATEVVAIVVATEAPTIIEFGEEVPGTFESVDWSQWITNGLLGMIFAVLLFNAIQALRQGGDRGLSEEIVGWQENREVVEPAENWYQGRSDGFKLTFNSIEDFLRFVGQVTDLQTPTSIANLLGDIRTPGAPIPASINAKVMSDFERIDQQDKSLDEASH